MLYILLETSIPTSRGLPVKEHASDKTADPEIQGSNMGCQLGCQGFREKEKSPVLEMTPRLCLSTQ